MISRRINPALFAGLALLATVTLFQEGLFTHIEVGSVHPDAVLLVALNWGLLRGVEEGMLWGFIGGVFIDLFSGLPFGTSSTAYVVIAGLVSLGEPALMRAHILLPFITAIMATAIYYAITTVVIASADHVFLLSWSYLRTVLGVALFNAVLNPVLYWMVQAFETRLHPVARTVL